MKANFILPSDLSEAQVEADVASYLGECTPFWSRRFRIKAVNEQITGADKYFDRFVPIYMQFKVSNGLKPVQKINFNLKQTPNQKIRNYRRANNLDGDPILCFKLRDKAVTASDFQHNILRSYHNPPNAYAFYVAPLTISAVTYEQLLQAPWYHQLILVDPFHTNQVFIHQGAQKLNMGLIPFLRAHISIPPQIAVTTSEHYYSFSANGSDVAWHGGDVMNGDFRLSSRLEQIFETTYNNDKIGIEKESFIEQIERGYERIGIKRSEAPLDDTPDTLIYNYSSFLRNNFQISLVLLGLNQ
jgi:hypothetical protein